MKMAKRKFHGLIEIFLFISLLIQSRKRKGSESSEDSTGGDNKRQNQFSFVERATQTKNNAEKVLIEIMNC